MRKDDNLFDPEGPQDKSLSVSPGLNHDFGSSQEIRCKLAAIVESSDDAIVSKNLYGIITSWNKGAERIFGYKAEEAIGSSILLLIPPERHSEEPEILKKLQAGQRIDHFQTIRRCKDGRLIDVSLTVSPLMDSQGKVIGASKIARDITQRKKAEESLKTTNQELKDLTVNLEKRVQERTQRLEEQSGQLRRLAVQLTEAEETERKHLAQILHDHLQQLLVAAMMRIELIQRKETGLRDKSGFYELRKYLDEAFDAARSLTAELRPPVLYEGGLIAALRFLAGKFNDQYRFKLHVSVADEAEPSSQFLKTMLYSAVREIAFNAVKYSGVSECWLEIQKLPNADIRLVIRDEGIGFDVENIGRKGCEGFGLFSIRERIKALSGECKIESSIGNGARFEITLADQLKPLVTDTGQPKGDGHAANQDKKGEAGLSVLLVDDHKILRQALATLLVCQPFIHDILEAEDGQEAVDRVRYTNPDVIIMDLNMPRLNGVEAVKIIHRLYPNIKIIGLSVQTEPEIRQTMKEAGAMEYFHKGEDTDVLIEALRNISNHVPKSFVPKSLARL